MLSEKRTCSGICKKFKVTKPYGIGRYEAGHGRCQMCDMWIDYRGAHTKDGMPAAEDSAGWFCNCCNRRIRRNPRNIKYKSKIKHIEPDQYDDVIELSYFNKRRAHMLRELGRAIVKKESTDSKQSYEQFLPNAIPDVDIEKEFGVNIDKLVELAKVTDPPNKISMIAEFERIRYDIGRTPTKQDIEKHSLLHVSQYEKEFESWEHLLNRMGYDPWYRESKTNIADVMPDSQDLTASIQNEKNSRGSFSKNINSG